MLTVDSQLEMDPLHDRPCGLLTSMSHEFSSSKTTHLRLVLEDLRSKVIAWMSRPTAFRRQTPGDTGSVGDLRCPLRRFELLRCSDRAVSIYHRADCTRSSGEQRTGVAPMTTSRSRSIRKSPARAGRSSSRGEHQPYPAGRSAWTFTKHVRWKAALPLTHREFEPELSGEHRDVVVRRSELLRPYGATSTRTSARTVDFAIAPAARLRSITIPQFIVPRTATATA
jgi:hypothetical protein